jgi:polar amino acid transport system ATP-binding protein
VTRLSGSAALPVIDVAPLAGAAADTATLEALAVAEQIQAACRVRGFFYVTGHGVPAALVDELTAASAHW